MVIRDQCLGSYSSGWIQSKFAEFKKNSPLFIFLYERKKVIAFLLPVSHWSLNFTLMKWPSSYILHTQQLLFFENWMFARLNIKQQMKWKKVVYIALKSPCKLHSQPDRQEILLMEWLPQWGKDMGTVCNIHSPKPFSSKNSSTGWTHIRFPAHYSPRSGCMP